jgi:hypothetical protein
MAQRPVCCPSRLNLLLPFWRISDKLSSIWDLAPRTDPPAVRRGEWCGASQKISFRVWRNEMSLRRISLLLVLLNVLLGISAALAADNPFVGTWKTNLAKSKYSPGPAPTKPGTVTIAPNGDNGIKVSVENITANGEKATINYSANFDGKEVPFVQNGPGAISGQTVSLKRIDSHTAERVTHLNGKILVTEHWVVSKDGKTRTNTQTGTGPKGEAIHNVIVSEKQ